MSKLDKTTVLVTGADGFIGSHLCEALVRRGAKVRAFVYYNSFGHRGWLDQSPTAINEQIEFLSGDVRDPHFVDQAVEGVELVFHLASLIAIPYSYQAPDSYLQTNIQGTVNVLNAARRHGVRRILHTSTSEVYGTARYVPIDEKHPLQPQSPYSASKIAADALAESYFRAFDLPVAIVRPFNTFGPRQSARAVIPTILTQLQARREVIELGALSPTRDFNFVADVADGFIAIAESDARELLGSATNIGSGKEISIGGLAELCMEITGQRAELRCDEQRLRPAASEVDRLCCDASKLSSLCGWTPTVGLKEGLRRTAAWLSENKQRYRPDDYAV